LCESEKKSFVSEREREREREREEEEEEEEEFFEREKTSFVRETDGGRRGSGGGGILWKESRRTGHGFGL
jgi:hypothetical protein